MNNIRSRLVFLIIVSIGLIGQPYCRAAPPADLVKSRLVADVSTIRPGEPFTLGVLLEIKRGWHVYWSNPGDSGLPTSVKFELPEGFTAGELQFPTPVRFSQPGNVVGFGYTKTVLLTARVQPPAKLTENQVKVAATASWLVCSEQCSPGKAQLELRLPISDQAAPSGEAELFRKSSAALPGDVSTSEEVAKVQWSADPAKGQATAVITWKREILPLSIALFPAADEALDVRQAAVHNDLHTTSITLDVRALAGQKPGTGELPAVLGYSEKEGNRRGIKTTIPVGVVLAKAVKG